MDRVSELERMLEEQREGYATLLKNKESENQKLKIANQEELDELAKSHALEKEHMKKKVELAFQKMQSKWQRDQKKLERAAKVEAEKDLRESRVLLEKDREITKLKNQLKLQEKEILEKIQEKFLDEKQKLVQSLTNDLEISNKHDMMNLEAHYKDRIKRMTNEWNAEKQNMVEECEHILAQTLELKERMFQQQKANQKVPTAEAFVQTIETGSMIHAEMLTPQETQDLFRTIREKSSFSAELDASRAAYKQHLRRKSTANNINKRRQQYQKY